MNTWRAGCSGSCTSGSEGGPGKPTSRNADRAPRSDPYTEQPTREGKVYCAVVLDVFSRRVVGWSIDQSATSGLVTSALAMAIRNRQPDSGTVIHSDSGECGGRFLGGLSLTAMVEPDAGAGKLSGFSDSHFGLTLCLSPELSVARELSQRGSRFAEGVTSYRAWLGGPVTVLSASFGEPWVAPP